PADAYTRPQVSACFIQSCSDDLGSIFNLVHDEARVFKYGSGSGTNFSKLRGKMERLSGGGTSSGLMSFLEVLDRAAGATKSGGITRRAAKMVVVDADHPEIRDFIHWKEREERKVQALIAAGYPSDFNDTINKWHTCKATDRIYASNPCSEFVFLDDTACNLASLNLLKFLGGAGSTGVAGRRSQKAEASKVEMGRFDVEAYKHACRI